ncbi:hypothetical protein ACQPW1_07895 [Nocardia sp. CA-128927]|uniref:hypothetical protein n=1 Tax=Nocardia sp. CA-128927 TaxID=3239975 RepID=UPI003D9692EA
MVDAEDARYEAYRKRKLARGEEPRAREDWRRVQGKWGRSRDFGNQFRDGMGHILGRTEEKGWDKEVHRTTDRGPRYDDIRHIEIRHAMEFKAGRVTKDALRQLEKDEHGLARGMTIEWYMRPNARIDREVAVKMQELRDKYPGQFRTVEITKEQFKQAIEVGKELAKQRDAQQKAVERAKVRAEQNRKMQQLREAAARGRADAPERVARERKTLEVLQRVARERAASQAERDRVARESAERVLREFPFPVPSQSQERGAVEIGGRVAPEVADAASVEREAADKARAAEKEQLARDAAREQDAARNAAYERLQAQGRLTEVQRLHWLGQGTDPHGAVREPPGHSPNVERGGTGQGPDRSRGITRDGR